MDVGINPCRAFATGVFLLVKSTKMLLMRGRRICLYPSVYLDAHGEEDEFLKRGRPLFLSRARYQALSELWVHSALDYDTLVWPTPHPHRCTFIHHT